ncbi:MAG: asparagine synthase-related protein [bacterium]
MKVASELKRRLKEAVLRNRASGLLLSGGLDSAILASISPNLKAITVRLADYGEDKRYAASVVRLLNIEAHQKSVDIEEAIRAIPEVIKVLATFDPAIPNDLVVYFGLKKAKDMEIDEVMTGDGADELFAGYSFMEDMDDLDDYIKRISDSLTFSSNQLGRYFGIEIRQPYIDSEIKGLALDIPTHLKIKDGHGKWILRKAFEDDLPKEIIWQKKRPLEEGSGMTKIREVINLRVSDKEFEEARDFPIRFMNKAHFYYYKIYQEVIGDIPQPTEGEKGCPGCGGGINLNALHCKVCGYVIK